MASWVRSRCASESPVSQCKRGCWPPVYVPWNEYNIHLYTCICYCIFHSVLSKEHACLRDKLPVLSIGSNVHWPIFVFFFVFFFFPSFMVVYLPFFQHFQGFHKHEILHVFKVIIAPGRAQLGGVFGRKCMHSLAHFFLYIYWPQEEAKSIEHIRKSKIWIKTPCMPLNLSLSESSR